MTSPHPATQKAELRRMLRTDRVLTTAQLERRGLGAAAAWLDLPRIRLTCRTRVTQSDSATDLTFVALEPAWLKQPPRELMHWAGLAEVRPRLEASWARRSPRRMIHLDPAGRQRSHLPDAEALDPEGGDDYAVEFDAGYAPTRIAKKMEAAAAAGYRVLYWATSIHARTTTVAALARDLHGRGRLEGMSGVIVTFTDFWSPHDPYSDRPRCHKATHARVAFTGEAGRPDARGHTGIVARSAGARRR
ncbi:hypothetical protein [Deinococcus alpinitundrae]|uniref:hypothetical protein n=1 Tax=Deinococcus alpinitundrae TaxID=468913 RepID=UPI00137AFF58|nr:hypothetical protein [Deinococcus alpinitundrae]